MTERASHNSPQRSRRTYKRKLESSSSFSSNPADHVQYRHKRNARSYKPHNIAFQERPKETDPHRIKQRQKQIDFGKNTIGYQRYIQLVPKDNRKPSDPHTPDVHMAVSKRAWDSIVRRWRRMLHLWDPPLPNETTSEPNSLAISASSTETNRTEKSSDKSEVQPQPIDNSEITIRLEDILEYQNLVALESDNKKNESGSLSKKKSWAEITDQEELSREEQQQRETKHNHRDSNHSNTTPENSIYDDYVDDI